MEGQPQYSIRITPQIEQKAIAEFGETTNPKEAGYILPSGKLLDFSGKREGGQPGVRSYDHRDIGRVTEEGGTDAMIAFMRGGALRIGQGNIDMYTLPTPEQKTALRKYIDAYDGEIVIEINEGEFYKEYDEFTSPRKILRDIDAYFAEAQPSIRLVPGDLPPSGLTLDEIRSLDPESQKAFRAAQKQGLKVGYRQGSAVTAVEATRRLDVILLKKEMDQRSRIEAANIILNYAPKEKRGDYIRRILKATTPKRLDDIRDAVQTYVAKADKRQAKNELKTYISTIRKEYKAGEEAFGKLEPKARDVFRDVVATYDFAKLSEKKQQQLESRDEFVKRLSFKLSEEFENLAPEADADATDLMVMGKARIDELTRLSKTPIEDLDADQIRYIQKQLANFVDMHVAKQGSRARRRAENLNKQINTGRQEALTPKERRKALAGLPRFIKWSLGSGQAQFETMVRRVSGKDLPALQETLIDEPQRVLHDRHRVAKDLYLTWRQQGEKVGIKPKDIDRLEKTTQVTLGGKKVNISYGDLLSIYAHTRADGNLERLLKTDGLNIETYFRDKGDILKKRETVETATPTLEELRAISEMIPDAHKKLLEIHFNINQTKQAPAINKMSREIWGYDAADPAKLYFHLSRVMERLGTGTQAEIARSIDMAGRYQPRTGGHNRIRIRPFQMEVMSGLQQDAMFATMAEVMQNATTLIANPKWRKAVREAGQGDILDDITIMWRRIQGLSADQSMLEQEASVWLR
ncbi:MAG: hypothetical protein ACXABY_29405, partial [Candidatus Thorarchaeota archaeon]